MLDHLSLKARVRVLKMTERVSLDLSQVLCDAHTLLPYVYFPTEGFISLIASIEGSPGVEVAMVGREGMLGMHAVLGGDHSPLRGLVQGSGSALRIEIKQFQKELLSNPPLLRNMHLYMYVLINQLLTSAACIRFHLIGQRLAGYLLMMQDRTDETHLHVTQEFLACMLGVRRVGITEAASALQRDGLIQYHRGNVVVLNRIGLEAVTCHCYAINRKTYSDLLMPDAQVK